ncbi:MAG: phytanoyl-CoA dioxygenase family protein [Halieaceae bacterium]|nr:phytanoyl-CoA dioxygenase family protein [Halieaceae bacterium]
MSENFDIHAYNDADHAATYGQLDISDERSAPEVAADFEALMRDGYVIIKNLIDHDTCDAIKAECLELLKQTGRNPFEGHATQRVYDVLSKTRSTDRLADHPRILGLMDRLFRPGFLLSQSQVINILPGEAPQALHTDDAFYRIPRPRQALGAATVWAIDEFTEENGSTVVIPGSHKWGDDRLGELEEAVPAMMPKGSVVFFLGTTWHGGGKNTSAAARFAITHQYCEAYMRQQENYLLELSKDTVRQLSPELQALVGYSIYPPFMGMVEGMHPLRLLENAAS